MAITLYDISVGQFLQTLGAIEGVLAKGLAFCTENKIDLEEVLDAKVRPDMLPFRFQVQSLVHHSKDAIEAMKTGQAHAPSDIPPHSYQELQALIADAIASLKDEVPAEINALEGRDVTFSLGEKLRLPFTAENFLMSFELPNFYFHASMTYAILRGKGVKLGKRDFMGAMKLKTA
ncbi:hypothetical protein sos41_13560 [Alphaproteobacteria bacterium SO-S41]|nr:hypothetical protein sos41_13560 [Alphaproteobacteria bacterium SO-S41]